MTDIGNVEMAQFHSVVRENQSTVCFWSNQGIDVPSESCTKSIEMPAAGEISDSVNTIPVRLIQSLLAAAQTLDFSTSLYQVLN